MKGLAFGSVAWLFLATCFGMEKELRDEILNHKTRVYEAHPVSGSDHRINKPRSKKTKQVGEAEVSGYHVEFFQAFALKSDDFTGNGTQFGSWYEDDVNNATRVEVATYYEDDAYPAEYITIGDTEYVIYKDDNGDIACETGTPSSSSSNSYEYIGLAFVTFSEDAFAIVWGPRLVDLYLDPTAPGDTKSYVGIDAFTGYPVIYTDYNSTFEDIFVWSRIHKTDVDATDFVVPSGVNCADIDAQNGDNEDSIAWYERFTMDMSKKFRISNLNKFFS